LIAVSSLIILTTTWLYAASETRSGIQIYDVYCAGCHASGVLQSPKLGDKKDWGEREKQGFEVLLTHAIKGYKNMPAKGGNPAIKDKEVENAIKYMLANSGLEQYGKNPTSNQTMSKTAEKNDSVKTKPAQKSKTSSVNSFNRLMKSSAEWNLPPAEDGIHDSENGGTHMLQKPKEAFESLSSSKSGNRVDWVKALENNEISPRYDRLSDEVKPIVMDLNIVREVKGSMPDVVYPHKQHTEWLDCSNCHPAIFIPQKGANQISMASILLGQKCGVCHGKVAFPVSECRKCHSKQKPLKKAITNKQAN
jgi:c(7)-type cytochrome triheme protein